MMSMSDTQLSSRLAVESRASLTLLMLVAVGLAGIFFSSSVDWEVSTREQYTADPHEAEEMFGGGSNSRRASYVALALLGAVLYALPGGQRLSFGNAAAMCWLAYVVVCVGSIVWSDAPWLTAKRAAILLLALVGICGVVRRLSLRDLIDVSVGTASILVVLGLLAELSLGTFQPWQSEYRFAGTVHPNTQGSHCALIVIAAFFGAQASRWRKPLYWTLLMAALTCLLLTKSRTSIGGCCGGLAAACFLGASRTKQTLVAIGVPFLAGSVLLGALLLDANVVGNLQTAAQLGRGVDADVAQMNGRLPLWTSVSHFIAERPWLGYGYHGFWTPERIGEVSLEQEWTVPNAHSALLDVLLSVGLGGGICFVLGLFFALHRAATSCRETGRPESCFVFSLLCYALVASLFESGFAQPNSLDSFITASAMFSLILGPSRGSRATRAGCWSATSHSLATGALA